MTFFDPFKASDGSDPNALRDDPTAFASLGALPRAGEPASRPVQPAGAPSQAAIAFQQHILAGVSRSFALTIPQLPEPLGGVVANAYLLCRIADTIEDEPTLAPDDKVRLTEAFADLVGGIGSIEAFVAELAPKLSNATSPAEHELIGNTRLVLQLTHSYGPVARAAIERCLRLMCRGMHRFQQKAGPQGLRDLDELGRYCYVVAGVVGEMLCELFCEYSSATAANRAALTRNAVAFGQGLQLTNILKDVWEDRARGVSWLPRAEFARRGLVVENIDPAARTPEFHAALAELVAVTHAQLRYAMEYTLAIAPADTGMRKFCAWSIGMALLTLRKILATPDYMGGADVKIPRRAVATVIALTGLGIRSNAWLRMLFAIAARGLPSVDMPPAQAPQDF